MEKKVDDGKLFGNRQKQSLFVLALMILGIIYMSTRTSPDSPSGQVRAAVEAMVKGAEERSIKPFKKYLSEDVKDSQGRGKEEMLRILRGIFFRYQKVSLEVLSLDVETQTNPDIITAELLLLMSDTPLPKDKGNFVLTFRNEGEWRVWEVDWEDAAGYGM
jgi:hypothetical protein